MVYDNELAGWVADALAPGGVIHARDAAFFFQECSGGGMLDEIRDRLAGSVPFVAASAARWDQKSFSAVCDGAHPCGDYADWSFSLAPELRLSQTMIRAVQGATVIDPYRTVETAQWLTGNGGEHYGLADVCATAHYAILWAGWMHTDYPHDNIWYEQVAAMRATLLAMWGNGPNVHISILFGDSAHKPDGSALPIDWHAESATPAHLREAFTQLGDQITTHDQFFFYATDHGRSSDPLVGGPWALPGGGNADAAFQVPDPILAQLGGIGSSSPQLVVQTSGAIDGAEAIAVRVNGTTLGYLDPLSTTTTLDMPPACWASPTPCASTRRTAWRSRCWTSASIRARWPGQGARTRPQPRPPRPPRVRPSSRTCRPAARSTPTSHHRLPRRGRRLRGRHVPTGQPHHARPGDQVHRERRRDHRRDPGGSANLRGRAA